MKRVALKTTKMNPEQLVLHARNIHDSMTANVTVFAAPPVPMTDFLSQIDELEAAQISTYNGGKGATIVRNQKKVLVKTTLQRLSWYVNGISMGDEAVMNLAGMVAAVRGPRRYDSIAQPKKLAGFSPYTGTAKLRWEVISNAKTYSTEYCPDPITDNGWKTGFYGSGANAEISGLESGKKYWFRVRALGSAGMMSDWSDPICILIS
jgi:hypothetical protein